jgi:hypothetical protein
VLASAVDWKRGRQWTAKPPDESARARWRCLLAANLVLVGLAAAAAVGFLIAAWLS